MDKPLRRADARDGVGIEALNPSWERTHVHANSMEKRYSASMATIQVRDVPEATHATLRRRAAEAGKSLQEYVLDLLNDVAGKPSVEEVLRRAGGRAGGRVGLKYAAQAIRAERDRR